MPCLAIDFGTSNTAAAVLDGGHPRILPLEGGAETLPTAIFLDFDSRDTLVGNAAVQALIDGREGRFMRALKSVLGTPLMRERRQFFNERVTLIEVVGRFLSRTKAAAEAQCGLTFDAALSGRPVHFHGGGAGADESARDAQALTDLRDCYAAAGFDSVDFLPEPEAAALSSGAGDGLGLVVDIGGGTSDFTLFNRQGARTEIIASHGIRLGGTDFDRLVSLRRVMPLLGMGSALKFEFGDQTHEAPVAIFRDLATWAMIPFLYTGATRRDAAQMAKRAVDPARFARLVDVLDLETGHDIAFAVERGKIAASTGDATGIDLSVIETGLHTQLSLQILDETLQSSAAQIRAAAEQTLAEAGTAPEAIDHVVYVGGSSLLEAVPKAISGLLPNAKPHHGRAFTAIIDGLALATDPLRSPASAP